MWISRQFRRLSRVLASQSDFPHSCEIVGGLTSLHFEAEVGVGVGVGVLVGAGVGVSSGEGVGVSGVAVGLGKD